MTITLDTDWISDVSMGAYSVQTDPSGNTTLTCISETRFERFLTIIESRLSNDGLIDPSGNVKVTAEYLASLLICDLIANGPVTNHGIVSENFGDDYSYSKSALTARSTSTNFLVRYEEELETRRKGKGATVGAVRKDYQIEFSKMSQGSIPEVNNSSSDYPRSM